MVIRHIPVSNIASSKPSSCKLRSNIDCKCFISKKLLHFTVKSLLLFLKSIFEVPYNFLFFEDDLLPSYNPRIYSKLLKEDASNASFYQNFYFLQFLINLKFQVLFCNI